MTGEGASVDEVDRVKEGLVGGTGAGRAGGDPTEVIAWPVERSVASDSWSSMGEDERKGFCAGRLSEKRLFG